MNILMTADPIGGVWTYALELARALAPFEVRVTLATMGAAVRDDQRRAAATVPGLILRESVFRLEWMEDPWRDVDAAGEWLLDVARETRADLIHLNGYAHASLPWSAPVVVVAHSCVCSWWRAVRGDDAPSAFDEYRRRVTAGLHAADAVVAPTYAMRDALAACYRVDAPEIAVINNGCAESVVRDEHPGALDHAEDAARAAKSPEQPFVLGVGRLWDDAKNLRLLAAAAPTLPWPVFVAGDAAPPTGAGGEEFSPTHVTRLGRLAPDDVHALMRRASIFALPARYEPFGLSALEAARAGCALVLGDIPSLREVWGDSATFVDVDDAATLTSAIVALASDDRRRSEMAERARQRAAHYTASAMAARYAALYSETIAGITFGSEEAACVS
jgi:glycosyltransferase involved in cell wall biosynthesis